MVKKKLFPGAGAKGTILTKFIKPKQPLPNGDKTHRTAVILAESFLDDRGRQCFRFGRQGEDGAADLHAISRYVHITQEGDIESFFFDGDKVKRQIELAQDKKKEPKIKWKKSKARQLLYEYVKSGALGDDERVDYKELYESNPEYKKYDFDKFAGRVASIRKTVKENDARARLDLEAFKNYVERHEVSYFSHKGYTQWQGSDAQKQLQADIEAGKHLRMSKEDLYMSNREYYFKFDLRTFRDKIKQEIQTAKFYHTLAEKGRGFYRGKNLKEENKNREKAREKEKEKDS